MLAWSQKNYQGPVSGLAYRALHFKLSQRPLVYGIDSSLTSRIIPVLATLLIHKGNKGALKSGTVDNSLRGTGGGFGPKNAEICDRTQGFRPCAGYFAHPLREQGLSV